MKPKAAWAVMLGDKVYSIKFTKKEAIREYRRSLYLSRLFGVKIVKIKITYEGLRKTGK